MKMYICGQWVDRDAKMPVINPFDQSAFDTVPRGTADDVEAAIASAVRGAVRNGQAAGSSPIHDPQARSRPHGRAGRRPR